ncbi:MAG: ABC transporter ATP-binding protein [Deltaproteobacteria bacterium]|nr:ABC transporter ATP-binding protein [Deltaproteobacteria bacterium]
MIEVSNLSYEYPGVLALDNISLSVEEGSITALVGPNGAGKTTLLRCLAALERPVSGSISIGNVDTLEDPRLCHAKVGYLRDIFGLYDELSVFQCLSYAGSARGIKSATIKEAATTAAGRLNLKSYLGVKVGTLSRGLRQRLAIAQAIIHEPKVLILDEPASGLDPEARHSLSSLFVSLSNIGMTLLVSSHILTELEEYSTAMVIINKGRIVSSERIKPTLQRSSGVDGELVTMRVALASVFEEAENLLGAVEGVSELRHEGSEIFFKFSGSGEDQRVLLSRLVTEGLPVMSYGEVRDNMHTSYLNKLKKTRGGYGA